MADNTPDTPTEPAEAPESAEQPIEAPELGETATDAPEGEETGKPGNEAARYRKRLRSTEAERDTLAATLETYRRREAETLAEEAGLASGADLFTSADLADLLAEDGTVDPERVTAAAAELLEARPHWRKGRPDFGGGDRGTDVGTSENPDPFARAGDAIRAHGRR